MSNTENNKDKKVQLKQTRVVINNNKKVEKKEDKAAPPENQLYGLTYVEVDE